MRDVGRHVVVDDLRLRGRIEVRLRVRIFVELVDIDDVEVAVLERHAGRHPQALDEGLHDPLAALLRHRIDDALVEGADEQRTLVAPCHLPRLRDIVRPDADLEALRKLDRRESLLEVRERSWQRLARIRRLSLLLLGLIAEEPVVGRLGPEFFLVRIV